MGRGNRSARWILTANTGVGSPPKATVSKRNYSAAWGNRHFVFQLTAGWDYRGFVTIWFKSMLLCLHAAKEPFGGAHLCADGRKLPLLYPTASTRYQNSACPAPDARMGSSGEPRSQRGAVLFHRDASAALRRTGQSLNPLVDHGSDRLQKFHPRIHQVLLHLRRDSKALSNMIQNFLANARSACVLFRGTFSCSSFVSHHSSFISIVSTRSCSFARAGSSAAIARGRPMWRLSVPISTIRSSPFLNNPISPLAANGKCI